MSRNEIYWTKRETNEAILDDASIIVPACQENYGCYGVEIGVGLVYGVKLCLTGMGS
jgi:hypothetical protein